MGSEMCIRDSSSSMWKALNKLRIPNTDKPVILLVHAILKSDLASPEVGTDNVCRLFKASDVKSLASDKLRAEVISSLDLLQKAWGFAGDMNSRQIVQLIGNVECLIPRILLNAGHCNDYKSAAEVGKWFYDALVVERILPANSENPYKDCATEQDTEVEWKEDAPPTSDGIVEYDTVGQSTNEGLLELAAKGFRPGVNVSAKGWIYMIIETTNTEVKLGRYSDFHNNALDTTKVIKSKLAVFLEKYTIHKGKPKETIYTDWPNAGHADEIEGDMWVAEIRSVVQLALLEFQRKYPKPNLRIQSKPSQAIMVCDSYEKGKFKLVPYSANVVVIPEDAEPKDKWAAVETLSLIHI